MIPLFLLVFCEIRPLLAPRVNQEVGGTNPRADSHGPSRSRVLSVVLSIEPGRSRHRGLAKAANRAIHLGFTVILP